MEYDLPAPISPTQASSDFIAISMANELHSLNTLAQSFTAETLYAVYTGSNLPYSFCGTLRRKKFDSASFLERLLFGTDSRKDDSLNNWNLFKFGSAFNYLTYPHNKDFFLLRSYHIAPCVTLYVEVFYFVNI